MAENPDMYLDAMVSIYAEALHSDGAMTWAKAEQLALLTTSLTDQELSMLLVLAVRRLALAQW